MTSILTPIILIVDDSITNRRIYVRLAHKLNPDANVVSFGNPREAMVWLGHTAADLIITDYKMPGMTGDEFIRQIRSSHNDPDVPIIVVTAYGDRQFRVMSLEAGATDFLLSPVDHSEFITRARNLLKLRAQKQILVQRAEKLERRLELSLTAQEQLLRESREALAQVIDTVPAMISAADRDGVCIFVNVAQAASAGALPEDLAGRPIELLFGAERGASSRRLDRMVLETGQPLPTREEEVVTQTGETKVLLTSKIPLRNSRGIARGVLTTSVDITERRAIEKRLQHMANHDALTGLPNRTLLRDRLRRELARGRRGDRQFALHFIDLDRFKAINDTHGHGGGDDVLIRVAEVLSNAVDESNTIARIGGDEFAVLQPNISSPAEATQLAERIIALLNQQEAFSLGASIGITISPQDGNEPDELLENSDQAMYSAKKLGGNVWQFFTRNMRPLADKSAKLEADLRAAITKNEFVLHYQPMIELRNRSVVGVEALLRWRRPGHELLRPSSFLNLAEETGLIVPINEWVLRSACNQLAAWRAIGIYDLRMSVNVSPVQFRRKTVCAAVAAALSDAGIPPALLDIELTESIVLGDAEDVVLQLHELRNQGISLSLDDFGTGYSSLSYVRNFPLDRLKIDRSFIQGLTNNRSDLAIVRTIIDLGHILRLRVVAEGIETVDQIALLLAEGCDEVQGYLYGEPMPFDVFADWLTAYENGRISTRCNVVG
jgi:diguanylate cyclase (GGDEF)-like protein/PAS domain S-box-containing protein